MKHYYHPASRGATTHWMLLELDVPHEQIVLDVQADETGTAEFRAINPMGKIPTLVDEDVVFGGLLDFCVQFGWLASPSPKVSAYVQRLRQRPAYRQSHA